MRHHHHIDHDNYHIVVHHGHSAAVVYYDQHRKHDHDLHTPCDVDYCVFHDHDPGVDDQHVATIYNVHQFPDDHSPTVY